MKCLFLSVYQHCKSTLNAYYPDGQSQRVPSNYCHLIIVLATHNFESPKNIAIMIYYDVQIGYNQYKSSIKFGLLPLSRKIMSSQEWK